MTPQEQAHFRMLKIVQDQPDVSQRELAEQLGISLGKTNYLIKALIEKGLIKAGNFQRAENKLKKITYLLTPAGIAKRIQLTRSYLARKEAEYQALHIEIQTLKQDVSSNDRS